MICELVIAAQSRWVEAYVKHDEVKWLAFQFVLLRNLSDGNINPTISPMYYDYNKLKKSPDARICIVTDV
jgi:hypothetical protein